MKTILKSSVLLGILYSTTINVPGDYPTIQEAIDGSSDGDIVNVSEGTYAENINFNGKNITVSGENRVSTIIDGAQNGSVVTLNNGENNGAVLQNFTIKNGLSYPKGGGIYVSGASPILKNLLVIENISDPSGQGGSGGGIMVEYSALTTIEDVLLANNSGIQGGGVFIDHSSTVSMTNCTISNNYAESGGGFTMYGSTITLLNSIVWGNVSENNQQMNLNGDITITYSDIEGLPSAYEGNGNIDLDPMFVDSEIGDYHLSPNSPCIDAGDPDSPLDPDGSVSDMGAYPYQMTGPQYSHHSLFFDGVDDYVEIDDSDELDGMEQLTVQFWANLSEYSLDAALGTNFIMKTENPSDYNSYSFYTAGDENRLTFRVMTTSGSAGANLFDYSDYVTLNEWHLLTGVYDGQNIQLYIDGILMVEDNLTGTVIQNEYPVTVANLSNPASTKNYYGKMDQLSIWNTALSESEIQSYGFTSPTGQEESLVGFWNFDDGEGSVLTDLTSNGNDGTIYGATWSDDGAPVMPASIASVEVGTVQGYPNSEISVPVHIDLIQESVSSIEISFSEFQDHMEFIDLELEGALVGDAEWDVVLNSQEDLLLTLSYGANEISGEGVLFHLRFNIPEEIDTDFVPIMVEYVHLDELDGDIEILNGGVEVNAIVWGDVSQNGDVSGYDASLILKYLVGTEELNENQLYVADVTQDATISALDASAIAQYVVQLIDVLPLDDPASVSGDGEFYVNDTELIPGEMLEIPIELVNGENLLSFEFSAEYDESVFTLEEVVWSDLIDHFSIEENLVPGSINIAGMGTTPDGEEGTFGSLRLYVNPEFSDQNTSVSMSYRINELVPVENIIVDISNSNLGLDNSLTPKVFALHQNYPNPFNPTTQIRYDLPEDQFVSIIIYDVMGRKIRSLIRKNQTAGYYTTRWDARNDLGEGISAGMYIYTIQAGEFRATKKMVLLK